MSDKNLNQNEADNLIPDHGALGPTRTDRAKPPKKKKRSFFLKFFLGLLFIGCLAFIALSIAVYSIAKDAPKLEQVKLEDILSPRILDNKGNLIAELGDRKRETVAIDEVPDLLKKAIMSIEDKRFKKHIGIDPIRIVGAAVSNLRGNDRQGGSTLTQQLIKLSFFTTEVKDQTYKRKIQEAWLSIQLEREKSKDEVITYYINKIYMANRLYGMETAAKNYYNKNLDQLTLAQTALMAGIPQAPAKYDPLAHPEAAKKRRDIVLSEMYKDEFISKKDYDSAKNEAIDEGLNKVPDNSKDAKIIDNYIKEVIEEVQEKTSRNIYTDGLDIYTNLDLDTQKYMYHMVNSNEYIDFPDYEAGSLGEGEAAHNFQTAMTVINPQNGQVVAQIGSRKVPEDVQLGENIAVSGNRDFGSTVKPITDYGPAIEYLNYSTGRYIVDEPYKFMGTNISVMNWDNAYRGNMTLRSALAESRNVPAAKLLEDVGLDKATDFLEGLGIEQPKGIFPANSISGNSSTLKMAGAYAPFANGGIYYKPYYVNKIVMADGQEEVFKPESKRAMKESTAYMVTDMLKDVLSRGTGTTARNPELFEAGKTGTSNYTDDVLPKLKANVYGAVPDISFVGYTTNYVVSIWTGYSDYLVPISGEDQQIAMLLYKYLIGYLSQNIDSTDWEMPADVVKIGSELYVKDHTTDQYQWTPPSSTWKTEPSSSSSSSQPPASTSSSSSSMPPVEQSSVEPVVPPVSSTPPPSSTEPPVKPEEPETPPAGEEGP